MIYSYKADSLWLTTGDLICTTPGQHRTAVTHFPHPLEWCMPGVIKPAIVCIGPCGRCVEAGHAG
jgi:hypothetical protein